MKLYLAASYGRRRKMSSYATKLEEVGVEIVSRWVYDKADMEDDAFEAATNIREKISIGLSCALVDLGAIREATHFALFAEPLLDEDDGFACPTHALTHGGRHFETGYALCSSKTVIIVGGIENVFHCLPGIVRLKDFRALLAYCQHSKKKHPPKQNNKKQKQKGS